MAQQQVNGEPAIQVHALAKRYGDFEAVRGIDFEVRAGEVFGTARPERRRQDHHGRNPRRVARRAPRATCAFSAAIRESRSSELKDRIGVCLQATNLPDKITVAEAMELFGSSTRAGWTGKRCSKRLQLWEKRERYYSQLSGGQKQRLALALALINDPQLLFLDEPTTGLDPQARLEIHKLIQELRAEQRTILLTTHYIEEAERLCDRVAIIDEGRIIAMGTPREIQARTLGRRASRSCACSRWRTSRRACPRCARRRRSRRIAARWWSTPRSRPAPWSSW